jgi:rare lipoprotein A
LLVIGWGVARVPDQASSRNWEAAVPHSPVFSPVSAKPFQIGTASWYGEYFDGKETASGEVFNMYDLTAAHPTLPLGTMVRVTNLRNHTAIVVKINDRGPVVPGRIIDLSYAAACALRFDHQGLQRVRLDVVRPETLARLEPVAFGR